MKTSLSTALPEACFVFAELLKLDVDSSPLPKVLAFFSVSELLKMKKISRKWRGMCTRAINSKCPDPPKAFQSNQELKDAISKWCTYDPEVMEELACTYGYPINRWDVSRVTDFSYLFYNNNSFNEYIGDWNISSATTMASMFYGAGAFNQPLTNWNTSKVTTMDYMFCFADAFNQPLDTWDTCNVTTMSSMFKYASVFNHPLVSWDTSQVTCMTLMFCCATVFNQSLASWNCSNVTCKYNMFLGATSFTYFDTLPQQLEGWEDEDD